MDKNTTVKKYPRILIAEDDKEMRVLLALTLRKADYEVIECCNGVELVEYITFNPKKPNLIISDIRMPGVTGMEALEMLHSTGNLPPVILITAFGDENTHYEAERLGAAAMFDKPFDIDDMLAKVREIAPILT